MMAHRNDFVVAVKVKGKVQREAPGKNGERNAFLPHDTEYSILLKNLSDRNAEATVFIDGADALGGEKILVPAGYRGVEIKRFMIDGDLNHGDAFRFVAVESGDKGIVDPSAKENGLIEVNFYHEKKPVVPYTIYTTIHHPHPPIIPHSPWWPYDPFSYGSGIICGVGQPAKGIDDMKIGATVLGSANINFVQTDFGDATMDCCVSEDMAKSDAGATAEGQEVHQSFARTSFDAESWVASTIKLRLKVRHRPLPRMKPHHHPGPKDTIAFKYCQECGAPVLDGRWKRCPQCGVLLASARLQ